MYDGLYKQMRLVVALLALQFVFLGALATIGLMDWLADMTSASTPSLEVQAPLVRSEQPTAALGSPPPDSDPASEDNAQRGVDTVEESRPN